MITPASNNNDGTVWGDQFVKWNLAVGGVIKSTDGASALDITKIAASALPVPYSYPTQAFHPVSVGKARYIRQIVTQYDDREYIITASWQQVLNRFTNIPDFSSGSLVKLTYHVPCRNESASWGGMYIEPQVSYNGGTKWWSLGSSGYDAVMNMGGAAIGSYFQSILIDPYLSGVSAGAGFGVQIRFYATVYDIAAGVTTAWINSNHSINAISGTAVLDPTINGTQHFAHIIVEELALLSGSE